MIGTRFTTLFVYSVLLLLLYLVSGAFRRTYRPGALDVGGRGDSEERYTDLVHLLWSPASSQCRQTPSPTKNTEVDIRKVNPVTQFVTLDDRSTLRLFSVGKAAVLHKLHETPTQNIKQAQ